MWRCPKATFFWRVEIELGYWGVSWRTVVWAWSFLKRVTTGQTVALNPINVADFTGLGS